MGIFCSIRNLWPKKLQKKEAEKKQTDRQRQTTHTCRQTDRETTEYTSKWTVGTDGIEMMKGNLSVMSRIKEEALPDPLLAVADWTLTAVSF